ncbi:hypothetical protein B1H10_05285 [candidate division KSB1 bacterium 4484_188]|nr:MAG: hypothetical protein B1H10_05285 [candidate division KSB1 bacterium 4484_188]
MNNKTGQTIRTMSQTDAYMLIVGNVIGIGIFTTTGYIASFTSSPLVLLFLWLIGGALAFSGVVTYAELASRFPKAGGDFHYLTHAYHPALGFFFGWSAFVVTYTGSIAVIAVGFSHYFLNLIPPEWQAVRFQLGGAVFSIPYLKIVAILIILIITWINARGVRPGTRWQKIFTLLGIGILLLFILLGLSSEAGSWQNLVPLLRGKPTIGDLVGSGAALAAIFFTYAGWTAIVYVAGEVRDPRQTIHLALTKGILTVVFLYFIINIVYLYAQPIRDMKNVVDIGYRSLLILRGSQWSTFFSLMIMIAVLSTLNATIMSGSRIYYAMARKGQFFPFCGRLHPRFRVPCWALWLQAGWTILLVLSGSFNQLLSYTVFIMLCFAFLASVSIFVLRWRKKSEPPPYSAWGFPYTSLFFSLGTLWILINTFISHPTQSLMGIGVILVGIPFYFYFNRWKTGKSNGVME